MQKANTRDLTSNFVLKIMEFIKLLSAVHFSWGIILKGALKQVTKVLSPKCNDILILYIMHNSVFGNSKVAHSVIKKKVMCFGVSQWLVITYKKSFKFIPSLTMMHTVYVDKCKWLMALVLKHNQFTYSPNQSDLSCCYMTPKLYEVYWHYLPSLHKNDYLDKFKWLKPRIII